MIFLIQLLIYCNDNNILGGGKVGFFFGGGGKHLSSNTLVRTLPGEGKVKN